MGGRHRHRSVSADVAIDRVKSEGALGVPDRLLSGAMARQEMRETSVR